MSEFDKDAKLEEILRQLRSKKTEREEKASTASEGTQVFRREEPAVKENKSNVTRVFRASDAPVAPHDTGARTIHVPKTETRDYVITGSVPYTSKSVQTAEQSRPTAPTQTFVQTREVPDARAEAQKHEEKTPAPTEVKEPVVDRNTRSLWKALEGDSAEVDQINKSALAPTIDTGMMEIDRIISESYEEETLEAEPIEEAVPRPIEEIAPVFTSSFATASIIPAETPEERASVSGANEYRDESAALDEMASEISRKGVLNVSENAGDENFQEFFNTTVIIDDKPLSVRQRNKKKKREQKVETPVQDVQTQEPEFDYEPAAEVKDGYEYTSRDQIDEITALLKSRKNRATVRSAFTFVIALTLAYLNVAMEYGLYLPAFVTDIPVVFALTNIGGILLAIIINAKTVFNGFGKLLLFRADSHSVTSFASIMALIESVVYVFIGSGDITFTAPIAAFALAFSALGDAVNDSRVFENFRTVSEDFDKFSTTVLQDQQFVKRLTRSLNITDASVLVKRKTGFVDGFMGYSESEDKINRIVSIPTTVVFLVSLCCGVEAYLTDAEIYDVIRIVAFAAAFSTPFISTLSSYKPIADMQRYLSRLGSVVPGFSAVDEVVRSNCIVMEGREIFPKGNVMLHGIKTFEKERIDKAILYAASVLIQSCDTLSHVFLNVIQGKTEMLYDVDSVVYEDGLGFSFWVEQNRILLGKREFLLNHEIEVPSRDYENRYTKKSTRDAIYLAVSGKLYAMFVVSYAPNSDVEKALRGFEREGIGVLIRTRDFNVSPERIANMYHVPRSMISMVSESDILDLQKMTDYVGHTKSPLTHIGTISSFVGGILACYNVKRSLKMSTAIELSCMIVGCLLAVALTILGNILTVGVTATLIFQLCWLVVSVVLLSLRRY